MILDTRTSILDTRCSILDTRYWILVTQSWLLVIGSWLLVTGLLTPVTTRNSIYLNLYGSNLQNLSYHLSVVGSNSRNRSVTRNTPFAAWNPGLTSSIEHPTSSIQYPVSDTRYPITDARHTRLHLDGNPAGIFNTGNRCDHDSGFV